LFRNRFLGERGCSISFKNGALEVKLRTIAVVE
jgi:hypothetical protein